MSERTRLTLSRPDAAEVFARFVRNWMGCYGPLVEAAGTLRIEGTESGALSALLGTEPVLRLAASWVQLEEWTGQDRRVIDRRLGAHLGVSEVAWLRFALWG
ncbi:MAG: hypothetical protein KF906_05540 [Actinobacteria bacterium]|nr:hypothetical protein [Actinomycetota bacterium]